jgi:hypothetical protein
VAKAFGYVFPQIMRENVPESEANPKRWDSGGTWGSRGATAPAPAPRSRATSPYPGAPTRARRTTDVRGSDATTPTASTAATQYIVTARAWPEA